MSDPEAGSGPMYSRTSVVVNAVISIVLTVAIIWVTSGFNLFYERLFRVAPTLEGGGVGADWVTGNTIGWLGGLIKLIHFVDVVMGLFILLMVFVHWGAFRRLAARMRQPDETPMADGGERTDGSTGGETQ